MAMSEAPARLSHLNTDWHMVHEAHQTPSALARAARDRLLERYSGAVRRYLGKALRTPEAVDEVFQEFALRLCRGDLHRANPEQGRFRNFIKTTLYHLIVDYHRRTQTQPGPLPEGAEIPAPDAAELEEMDRVWLIGRRNELLNRAWAALAEIEVQKGTPIYTVLRLKTDRPSLQSEELAQHLRAADGSPMTAAAARQLLHRARERFSGLLLSELIYALGDRDADALEEALMELGMLSYCRIALEKIRHAG